jgi:NAD(P)-dependent dehydrogenase (short-subunit alcohol dehydrogenase family)
MGTSMSRQALKVAVITGASQGIGAGLVEGYRKAGFGVVATSRTIAESDDPGIVTIQGDIADPATADRVIAAALDNFGRIDTLVNNAGSFIAKPFTEYTQADYDTVLGVNVTGFFHITQRAVEVMVAEGSGHVVQITTSLVEHANSAVTSVLASLTKGGLQAATKALAIEYAGSGLRSNAVALGTIMTPMHAPQFHEALAAMHPIGRMGEVADVVDAVLYLENAPFVTGSVLHVDGGQGAGH